MHSARTTADQEACLEVCASRAWAGSAMTHVMAGKPGSPRGVPASPPGLPSSSARITAATGWEAGCYLQLPATSNSCGSAWLGHCQMRQLAHVITPGLPGCRRGTGWSAASQLVGQCSMLCGKQRLESHVWSVACVRMLEQYILLVRRAICKQTSTCSNGISIMQVTHAHSLRLLGPCSQRLQLHTQPES